EYIGFTGAGSFAQTGGVNKVSSLSVPGGLFFGYTNGASGTGTLSGGNLAVAYQEYIGYFGSGMFTQSGGSNTTHYLTTGWQPAGNGTMVLSGGTLDTFQTYTGFFGNGNFFQSGGIHTTSDL